MASRVDAKKREENREARTIRSPRFMGSEVKENMEIPFVAFRAR
jgi:hypothetical protein